MGVLKLFRKSQNSRNPVVEQMKNKQHQAKTKYRMEANTSIKANHMKENRPNVNMGNRGNKRCLMATGYLFDQFVLLHKDYVWLEGL